MKKILMLPLFFLIFSFGCQNIENEKANIDTKVYISDNEEELNYSISLPNTKQEKINAYIESEVMGVFNTLKENYRFSGRTIQVNYETFPSRYAISYLFAFRIFHQGIIEREIKRTFNFDIGKQEMILLNDSILSDIYLPLINQELERRKIVINRPDLKMIKYLIMQDEITFIIPKEVTLQEEIEIIIPNRGDVRTPVSLNKPIESKKLAALTFDDGPSARTCSLVDLLNQYQIKATFFLLGERVQIYPKAVEYIDRFGHEIGNHSYSHPDFTTLAPSKIVSEIEDTQKAIFEVISVYPKLFRFPYGNYQKQILKEIPLPIVLWDCDSEDWRYYDSDIIFSNVLHELDDNAIILFHDFSQYRKKAIEKTISYLKRNGYEFVTVSELLSFHKEENIVYGKIYP